MSVWASVSGKIILNKHCHLSVAKLIDELFDERTINKISQVNRDQIFSTEVDFVFSADGLDAATQVNRFVLAIKAADKHARVDIDATVRFLA